MMTMTNKQGFYVFLTLWTLAVQHKPPPQRPVELVLDVRFFVARFHRRTA